MPWAREPTIEGTLRLTERDEQHWQHDTHFNFAVVEKAGNAVVGVAGLNREQSGTTELHYWIRTDRTGRGLTTEACRVLIEWAARDLKVASLTLWAGHDNHASRRVAEKLGFKHVGPLSWRPEGGLGDFAAESYELSLDPVS